MIEKYQHQCLIDILNERKKSIEKKYQENAFFSKEADPTSDQALYFSALEDAYELVIKYETLMSGEK